MKYRGTETGRFPCVTITPRKIKRTTFYAPCCNKAMGEYDGTCPACKEPVIPVELCDVCQRRPNECTCT